MNEYLWGMIVTFFITCAIVIAIYIVNTVKLWKVQKALGESAKRMRSQTYTRN